MVYIFRCAAGRYTNSNITGLTHIDFIALPPKARVSITYQVPQLCYIISYYITLHMHKAFALPPKARVSITYQVLYNII